MESRKMVLKNLFAGQQWRNRHREQIYGQRGEEKVRGMKMWHIYTMEYYTSKKWIKLCHFSRHRLTYSCHIQRSESEEKKNHILMHIYGIWKQY